MCPACVSNMALMVAGLTTTGGLTALITPNIFRSKKSKEISDPQEKHEVKDEKGE